MSPFGKLEIWGLTWDKNRNHLEKGAFIPPIPLREGARFVGPHHWHSENEKRGGNTFPREKKRGRNFLEERNDGATTFYVSKSDGVRTFPEKTMHSS